MKLSAPVGALVITLGLAGAALAQSTGASPADPNNERNQRPAPSNVGPADPATDSPAARIPTAPEDRYAAEREEGGADGASSGDPGYVEPVPPGTIYVPE